MCICSHMKWLEVYMFSKAFNERRSWSQNVSSFFSFVLLVGENSFLKWASSGDYGTYHIGKQRRSGESAHSRSLARAFSLFEVSGKPAHPRSLARAFAVRTHEVWKETKGPTKNQTSSPTGWLCMRDWGMSLRRMKSAIISWAGSNKNSYDLP